MLQVLPSRDPGLLGLPHSGGDPRLPQSIKPREWLNHISEAGRGSGRENEEKKKRVLHLKNLNICD